MSIPYGRYEHLGMENYDGGSETWDFDHDGKFSLFEENSRHAYDQVLYERAFSDENTPDESDWDSEFEDDDNEEW